MKIVDVRAAGLRGGTPAGGWTHELDRDDTVHTLVAVETDEGTIGLGSVFTSGRLVEASLDVLRPLCLGADALEPEHLTENLDRTTFWMGRGGAITHAISGIDLALWDIFGQASGQSVSRLLGGRWRDRVKPYASVLMDYPAPLRDTLQSVLDMGYRAVKIGWGPFGRVDGRTDEAVIACAREVLGDDCELMVDAGGSDEGWRHGFKWALRTAHMLNGYGVEWFEEPLHPDNLDDFIALRAAAPLPISGGEVLTRRQSFLTWLRSGALDIVQPDVTKVGGLSVERRIGWLAEDFGVRLVPHGWNTAIGLASDLQLAAALPGVDRIEYITGSPYIDDISGGECQLDQDGMLAIPDEPGLGYRLDPDALGRYMDDAASFLGGFAR